MKKIILLILMIVLTTVSVSASWKDMRIMNVENCYNLTIRYDLTDGESTGVKFSGCVDKGNQTWFCNCRRDDNSYNLVMQTDNTIIRDAREYELEVSGYVYQFYKDEKSIRLLDWGDYFEIKTKNVNDFGEDSECKQETKIVYRNVTVPVEVVKEVPIETIKEVPVNVTSYVYLENTTRVSELGLERDVWMGKAKNRGLWMWLFLLLSIGALGFIGYQYSKGE